MTSALVLPETGVQTPRIDIHPLYFSSVGEDAVSWTHEVAGMSLFPWQDYVLENMLTMKQDGRWAAPDVGLIVPRQNGKGEIIQARELFGMFMLREKKIIHTAHEFKSAKEGLSKLQNVIARSPELSEKVQVKTGNTEPGVYWIPDKRGEPSPRMIQFLARSGGSGRGFSCDFLVMDEAFAVTMEMVDAMEPTMGAVPNAQTLWASSAGFAYSHHLAALRKRAFDGDNDDLAFMEWSVDEDDFDPGDPREWAKANPSAGYLMSWDFLNRRFKTSKAADNLAGFAREHLGVWEMFAANSEIPESKWRKARMSSSEIVDDRVVVSLDVSAARRASVVVTGATADGSVQSEVVFNDEVSPDVVATVRSLVDRWDVLGVCLDASGPAGQWLSALSEVGVEVKPFGSRMVAQADGGFKEKVLSGRFVHVGQKILDHAVLAGVSKPTGDLWVFDRNSDIADMTPLKAASLGVSHFEFLIGQEVRHLETVEESWFF